MGASCWFYYRNNGKGLGECLMILLNEVVFKMWADGH